MNCATELVKAEACLARLLVTLCANAGDLPYSLAKPEDCYAKVKLNLICIGEVLSCTFEFSHFMR